MRATFSFLLLCILIIPLKGRKYYANKPKKVDNLFMLTKAEEPNHSRSVPIYQRFGPITTYQNRNSEWNASLVDSSYNGYGAYLPFVNPLDFHPEYGFLAIYRQWQGYNDGSGWLGAATSYDGEEWFTEQTLNESYPTGEEAPNLPTYNGLGAARFPNAAIVPGGKHTAIWSETTNPDQGGGINGGYPLDVVALANRNRPR